MNDEQRIIKLEVKNEFLQRENAALMEEVNHLRVNLAEAERELSIMRVELHIAHHEAKDAKKPRHDLREPADFD